MHTYKHRILHQKKLQEKKGDSSGIKKKTTKWNGASDVRHFHQKNQLCYFDYASQGKEREAHAWIIFS